MNILSRLNALAGMGQNQNYQQDEQMSNAPVAGVVDPWNGMREAQQQQDQINPLNTNKNNGWFGGMSGLDKLKAIGGGISTLASLYNGFQQNKIAKDQLNFQKQYADINMNNTIKSYNTQLADIANTRAAMEGRSDASAQEYINENQMTR